MPLSCYVPSQITPKSRVVHLADKQILKRHILSYPKIIVSKKNPGGGGGGGGSIPGPWTITRGYEMANKHKIKNERTHGEKEGEKREKTTTLSEKKEEASNVSEQRDKGWIHVIRVHDTIHLAVTTTRQGNRRSRTTPLRAVSLNIETTPPPPPLTRTS